MATKIDKATADVVAEFDFQIGEPPAFAITRKSKHAERWAAAMKVAQKITPQSVRMVSYDNSASPNNLARAINNDERDEFLTTDGKFTAKSAKDDIAGTSYSVWLMFTPNETTPEDSE